MQKRNWLQRVSSTLLDNWVISLVLLLFAMFTIFLLTWQLHTLLPGASQPEFTHQLRINQNEINPINTITQQPLFLPFTLSLYLLQLFSLDDILFIRLTSAIFGLISIVAVYYIISRWHTFRISVFATLLYASSAGFLHLARFGDEVSMYLLIPVIIAAGLYSKERNSTVLKILTIVLAGVMTLYIPGMIWLVLVLCLLYYKRLLKTIKSTSTLTLAVGSSIGLLFIGLLVFSFVINPSNLFVWLGLPADGLPDVLTLIQQMGFIPVELFAWGPDNLLFWVGVSGIIDIFVTVLFILGCYSYFYQRKLDRTKILFVSMFTLIILAGFGGPVTVFALVPFIYIIAATGLALLLQQWFTVFPKNPFARTLAIAVIVLAISMSVMYNTHRYFVAWPRTPAVQAQFDNQLER